MVMDEPLSALDSFTSLKLMQELRGLVDKERISVILSLHQPRAEVLL
jgi:ABC-type nitrate/sulfonate/bicarbonate transport system ATPase subunit